MTEAITIPTERAGVTLNQLSTLLHDRDYFAALCASQVHLSRFNAETLRAYPDETAVTAARFNAANAHRLRLGIYHKSVFRGAINLSPDRESPGTEYIGYWLDARHTGSGYATVAVNALCAFAFRERRTKEILARVDSENYSSQGVLERAGFLLIQPGREQLYRRLRQPIS